MPPPKAPDLATLPADEFVAAVHPYGTWTDEHSTGAAHQIAELVRYLNHATIDHADRAIPTPNTAAAVIGALETTLRRLPQLLGQLADREAAFATHPAIAAGHVPAVGDDPRTVAALAVSNLHAAAPLLAEAADVLGKARRLADRCI